MPNTTHFPDVPCTSVKCCTICAASDASCVSSSFNDYEFNRLMKIWWKHVDEYHLRVNPKSHVGNGAPQGQFAFTLTSSPTDGLTVADMVTAVNKVLNQKSCPTKSFAWYLEYGDPELQAHPHIHGMYETESGGRIEAKHFKRAWKVWDEKVKMGFGFRGGYHRPVRDKEAYTDYIAKQQNEYHGKYNC